MACLILAESAIFIIFVVAYIFYIGRSLNGPTPSQVLELPIFSTICLLSSSLTVHFAVHTLRHNKLRACGIWLSATVHATHVVVGLLMLSLALMFSFTGALNSRHAYRLNVVSLYWHFVDAVWVVVFTVVYVLGR